MIKLLVVDSHPIIRKGLELLFSASTDITIGGNLDNGAAIFDFLQKNEVDVIMLEIDLPKLNGITALRNIKETFPNVKTLFFTAQPEDVYAINTIKAGASGYLNKTANLIVINEAIHIIMQGNTYLSNRMQQRLNSIKKRNQSGAYYKKLSTREIEVLKLIAIGKKNKEIATELAINEKTVSTYKTRLMKKLAVDNIVDLINRAKTIEL